jgi:putative ABC transport system permease protein
MLLSYLRVALRNLSKYKAFSTINIAGMAVSLASCLLITLFVWDETTYDRHITYGERTYRVYNVVTSEGSERTMPIVPYPYASQMKKDFAEVETTLRIMDLYGEQLMEANDKKLMEGKGIFAERTVFDMLGISVIHGDPDSALARPGAVALSSSLAEKYFGPGNPVGKTIRLNNNENKVTAVFADITPKSHLQVNYMVSFASSGWEGRFDDNWRRQQIFTYLRLTEGADAKALEAKLLPFVERHAYPKLKDLGMTYVPNIQNVRDIHLHSSNFQWEIAERGDAQAVYILIATAIMLMLIAVLNFINLSTARAVRRMKEVGIRKVAGAARRQLMFQFVFESVLLTFFAMVIALVLAESAMPYLNRVVEKDLIIPYGLVYAGGALVACMLIGAMAGSYPAIHLSRFRPVAVLSGKGESRGGAYLRQGLVIVQFMLSFFLIAGSTVVFMQNELVRNKDLGFDKDQLLIVPLRGAQLDKTETTKALYADHPNVLSVTIGYGLPGDIIAGDGVKDPVTNADWSASLMTVDFDYIPTMGMRMASGRAFSKDIPSDSIDAFIVNEAFVQTYGLGDPDKALGKELHWERWDNQQMKKGKIIGVVKDFNFKSLREKITPMVLHIFPQVSWKMAARIKSENVEETVAHFKKTYESLDPEWAFSYSFLDQNFASMYETERKLGTMFSIFTYLAIAVACLGLFGLVEYSVNQRTKEVSIRKVLGADVPGLLLLLTQRYFILLAIAIALVVPLSWYVSKEWLNNFAYHIEIEPMIFIRATLIVLTVTAFTVSFQSVKAAMSNPAKNLRND